MTQEALKLALEALKAAQELAGKHDAELEYGFQQAITAIKEALAQEQELTTGNILMDSYKAMQSMKTAAKPQRTWVGLAAEDRLTAKYMQDAPDGIEAVIDYIEAKLKELNT
jgi:hypothetical protein